MSVCRRQTIGVRGFPFIGAMLALTGQLDGFSKTDVRGNSVTCRYSTEDTADSLQRMFRFLDRTMASRPLSASAAQ